MNFKGDRSLSSRGHFNASFGRSRLQLFGNPSSRERIGRLRRAVPARLRKDVQLDLAGNLFQVRGARQSPAVRNHLVGRNALVMVADDQPDRTSRQGVWMFGEVQ